ncbi:MAG TPA: putative peptidoglycan glycosyltransferase FtsW [Chitinispirillaceae bacterium]|nr:putative peptidoglycan glycosyltransferase FtsW [Chitinispirillaceae bacterium]
MSNRMAKMDVGLFTALLIMLGFGIVFVYSSSFAVAQQNYGGSDFFLSRQTTRAVLAIVSFMVFINVDYHLWGRLSNLIYLIVVGMLVFVLLLPDSYAVNGAKRWIFLGPVRFQVSDVARMALILVLARGCEKAGAEIREWPVLLANLLKIGLVCVLILLEPNFSTCMIFAITGLAILFLSGAKFSHLASLFLAVIPVVVILVLKEPYRRARLTGFLQMSEKTSSLSYQTYQSLIGLGNGGIFGVGIGKGEQKFFYLPEPHTDFAISIMGEEIGFVGLMIIMALFAFIVYRGMKIAFRAPDKMGQLMAFGFSFAIALYVIVHASVGTGLIPTTGVPLPFLSYGGMSLIFMMSSMGILLNISSQSRLDTMQPKFRPVLPVSNSAEAKRKA